MHSTRGRGRDCQSLDSDVLANKESASTGSAISMPQGSWLIRMEFSVGPPQNRQRFELIIRIGAVIESVAWKLENIRNLTRF
jgi:hypothetical protein